MEQVHEHAFARQPRFIFFACFTRANRIRIHHAEICKLACKAYRVRIFAEGEIPSYLKPSPFFCNVCNKSPQIGTYCFYYKK